jgi:hypothetical protein
MVVATGAERQPRPPADRPDSTPHPRGHRGGAGGSDVEESETQNFIDSTLQPLAASISEDSDADDEGTEEATARTTYNRRGFRRRRG